MKLFPHTIYKILVISYFKSYFIRKFKKWGNNRSLNGIDGNKKVKGIKVILADGGYRGELIENIKISVLCLP